MTRHEPLPPSISNLSSEGQGMTDTLAEEMHPLSLTLFAKTIGTVVVATSSPRAPHRRFRRLLPRAAGINSATSGVSRSCLLVREAAPDD